MSSACKRHGVVRDRIGSGNNSLLLICVGTPRHHAWDIDYRQGIHDEKKKEKGKKFQPKRV